MSELVTPDALQHVLELLPSTVRDARTLRGDNGPWLVEYGSEVAVLRWNDPVRFQRLDPVAHTPALALESVMWLHEFLRALADTAFVAPVPMRALCGESIAVIAGSIWELLTFVPGKPMSWGDVRAVSEMGRALARFHGSSLSLPARPQRPGSLPFDQCRPTDPRARLEEVRKELDEIGYSSAPRGVIHGDGTVSNMVLQNGEIHLVDFAIGYEEVVVADIGCALWRTGRIAPDAHAYDPARVAAFVAGYAAVSPLRPSDPRAIVVYLKCRGLQLQHRTERRGWRTDDTVMQRLLSLQAQQDDLELAIRSALARS